MCRYVVVTQYPNIKRSTSTEKMIGVNCAGNSNLCATKTCCLLLCTKQKTLRKSPSETQRLIHKNSNWEILWLIDMNDEQKINDKCIRNQLTSRHETIENQEIHVIRRQKCRVKVDEFFSQSLVLKGKGKIIFSIDFDFLTVYQYPIECKLHFAESSE